MADLSLGKKHCMMLGLLRPLRANIGGAKRVQQAQLEASCDVRVIVDSTGVLI